MSISGIGARARAAVRKGLWNLGFEVQRYNPVTHPVLRKRRLFTSYGIDVVVDVGANSGQFAERLRREDVHHGRIVSFEPLAAAFAVLEKKARADGAWAAVNEALGEAEGESEINVAGNSFSSSILDMLPRHADAAPHSTYVAKEKIRVSTLDAACERHLRGGENVFLKIDTQGYEMQVLRGGTRALDRIDTIQLEMSLVPLYDGAATFVDIYTWLVERGYVLVLLEPGFSDPHTGQLLQTDGVFHRFRDVNGTR